MTPFYQLMLVGEEWDEDQQSYIPIYEEHTYTETDSVTVYTDPTKADTDGDLLLDGDEILLGLNPCDPSDGEADADADGLTFAMEYYLGTDPDDPDTDGDGLPDGWEVAHGFDPLNPDDGLYGDEDEDGVANGQAYQSGGAEAVFGSGATGHWHGGSTNRDTDGDGISDQDEMANGTDPFDPDDPEPPPPPPPCNP